MARNKQKMWVDQQPDSSIELPFPKITADQWEGMSSTLNTLIDINLSNREELDNQLDRGNAMYEMRAADHGNDTPYPGSANVMVPLIASVVDEFASRISGTAILPRPLLVRGNDPVSADQAHTVEQFYNGEYQRNCWEEKIRTGIQLGGRDGTSVMGVFWKQEVYERVVKADSPMPDGTMSKKSQRIRMIKYDAPELVPIELRDFVLIPAYAISINTADAVCWKRYMGEAQLTAMVNADVLDEEMVEKALSYVNEAQGDLSYDRQGTSPYTINNRINVVDTSVAGPAGIKMNRGPIRVWQIHSSLFDMDDDGVSEENIFWFHDESRTMIGWAPYEYWGERPFFECAPFERPNRFYGFSIPERIQALQEEADVQHLTRLEVLDRVLNPTHYATSGAKLAQEDQKLGVLNVIRVQNKDDLGYIQMPPIPEASLQEEQYLTQLADRVVGAPQAGGQPSQSGGGMSGGGRVSARAAQQNAAIQGLQTNMVISRTRLWMLKIFQFAHMLYKQYGKDQMDAIGQSADGTKRITVPKEILGLDFTLGVAGQGGPLDKESRRQDWQVIYQLLMQNPLVQGDVGHIYGITASLLETFEVTEITRLIGTLDEAKQKQAQQQAAAQEKEKQDQVIQLLSHTKVEATHGGPTHSTGGQERAAA